MVGRSINKEISIPENQRNRDIIIVLYLIELHLRCSVETVDRITTIYDLFFIGYIIQQVYI